MKLFDLFDCTQKPVLFTPWSLIHGVTGILSYSFYSSFLFLKNKNNKMNENKEKKLFWLHALYECKDLYYSYIKQKNLNPNLPSSTIQNSVFNSIGDQFIFMIGVYISKKYEISFENAIFIQILAFFILASPIFERNKKKWNFDVWYRRG